MEQTSSSPAQEESVKAVPTDDTNLEPDQNSPDPPQKDADSQSQEQNEEVQCAWQEICDDSTGYSYYWNMHTNEVTWDRPEEYANYIQSLNSVSKENNLSAVSNEANVDKKKSKRKKESPQLPEGAIIPISYYGNSSSEDDSDSERESARLAKKKKVEKPVTSKKNKSLKKQSAKSNPNEEEYKSEIIGPQLPPDFQFPLIAAVEEKEVEKHVEMGPHLPPDFVAEVLKSNMEDVPDKESVSKTSADMLVKDVEVNSQQLIEQPLEKTLDSDIKSERSVGIQGYRPVVDYDSFTDEEEEIPKVASSNQFEATETKSLESKLEVEDKDLVIPVSQPTSNSEADIFNKSTKRKTIKEPKVKSSELAPQGDEKYLKTSVDIDSLFAAHSSYGKYGFGFGFREEQSLEDEEAPQSRQGYKNRKGQFHKKAVSFVKSSLVLDLGSLSKASKSEAEPSMTLEKEESPNIEKVEAELKATDESEEAKEDIASDKSSSSSSSDEEESSSTKSSKTDPLEEDNDIVVNGENVVLEESLKLSAEDPVVPERSDSPDTSSFEFTDDLDEIDKALCEALYKKQAQSALKSSSVSKQAATEVLEKDIKPQVTEPSVKKRKTEDSASESKDDTEFKTRMVDMASILIDKLTFLLSNSSSTLPSLNSLFFQLQTRFVDWQANALDSCYFEARVKEVNDYLLHYETGVVSGDWTCQWDRSNKRYFYLNQRTQFSQWTFPEELCAVEETPPIESPPKTDSSDALMVDQDSFSTVSSSVVDVRGAPSPPPPPPGVDSPPPPLPPQTPPPCSPPPSPEKPKTEIEPEDMDLDNSNDSSSPGDYLINTNPASPTTQPSEQSFITTQIPNLLPAPLFPITESRNLFPIIPHGSHVNELPPTPSLEAPTTSIVPVDTSDGSRIGVSGSLEVSGEKTIVKQSKTSKPASVPVKRKKTKIQPGLGLKKKNIPSLVEKWQKIKEEQEREDKSNDSNLPITF